jgi:hypothetical protein
VVGLAPQIAHTERHHDEQDAREAVAEGHDGDQQL